MFLPLWKGMRRIGALMTCGNHLAAASPSHLQLALPSAIGLPNSWAYLARRANFRNVGHPVDGCVALSDADAVTSAVYKLPAESSTTSCSE